MFKNSGEQSREEAWVTYTVARDLYSSKLYLFIFFKILHRETLI